MSEQPQKKKRYSTKREYSKQFRIPQGTISDYVRHNHDINDHKPGRKTIFSPEVEKEMVTAATDVAQMGLGLSRYQFMATAGNVACQMNMKTPW